MTTLISSLVIGTTMIQTRRLRRKVPCDILLRGLHAEGLVALPLGLPSPLSTSVTETSCWGDHDLCLYTSATNAFAMTSTVTMNPTIRHPRRKRKPRLQSRIFDTVIMSGGRFLKRSTNDKRPPKETSWIVAEDAEGREKVSNVFRNFNKQKKRKSNCNKYEESTKNNLQEESRSHALCPRELLGGGISSNESIPNPDIHSNGNYR